MWKACCVELDSQWMFLSTLRFLGSYNSTVFTSANVYNRKGQKPNKRLQPHTI